VTTPWSEAKFVPELLRDSYLTAFRRFGWAGDHVGRIIFGLLGKFRENFLDHEDKLRVLTGARFEEARRDPAFAAVVAKITRRPGQLAGRAQRRFQYLFLAKSAYCQWAQLKTRTLILHDQIRAVCPCRVGGPAHRDSAVAGLPSRRAHPLAGSRCEGHAPKPPR
jgi:hypothetical protein